ncbi:nitrate reductase cytochrome c-type subunit [Dongia sedimenti]|uniref:Periplasmic nitrate reductase, electron transfer subunit n=1 Tax=Dongia sedimenti TaxID=3064282 RepID=A0ABU0YF83_9PROT|nr:nitrate reductase cytochrome c-type subunit [Rhodospirillaceae bacterium R-7]
MSPRRFYLAVTVALALGAPLAVAQDTTGNAVVEDLRGEVPLTEEMAAPPVYKEINDDLRRARNYPEQPPVIPHNIRDYPITLNANKCLTCHTREFTAQSQAPMISITHFMDRDGQVLATVTPRRYFCTQCHVTQAEAPDLVQNDFAPIEEIMRTLRQKQGDGETENAP